MLFRVIGFGIDNFCRRLTSYSVVEAVLDHCIEISCCLRVAVIVNAALCVDVCNLLPDTAFFIGERFETGHWVFTNIANCEQGMTMAFLTMSMCEIFHSFNMRSQRGSVISMSLHGSHNLFLFGAMIASLVLTTAVIEVPFLANAFGFTPIGFAEYAVSLALAFSVIPIVELVKLIQRRISHKK